jgi:hypothetical protein
LPAAPKGQLGEPSLWRGERNAEYKINF